MLRMALLVTSAVVLIAQAPAHLRVEDRLPDPGGKGIADMQLLKPLVNDGSGAETLAWMKGHAIPLQGVEAGHGFADMQPLKALVGEATVVALGEATHGTREFFQLKHRMLEFLATDMGFTVFAIEANLPEAFAVDDYVLTGRGDPAKALAGLYFWTWDTEEVLGMIRWMRAYNEDSAHLKKLRFYGVDMQTDTVAYAQAKAWLEGVDPQEAAKLIWLKDEMAKLPLRQSGKQTEGEGKAWATIAQELEALVTRLESKGGASGDFDRQRQNLHVLAQRAASQANSAAGYKVRDESMATNLRWIQAREHGAKVVLWAHNMHIRLNPPSSRSIPSMGWYLRQSLGKAYLPIGFAFSEGGFQAMSGDPNHRGLHTFEVKPRELNTLDLALAATGHQVLALDLRARPKEGPVKRWLETPQGTWNIGAVFTPGQENAFILKEPITDAYDALLFVNRTTRARPMGRPANPPPSPAASKALVNLGFEEGLKGWVPSGLPYQTSVVEGGAKEGTHCLQIAYQGEPTPNPLGMTNQALDATSFRGKKVRLRGWIRTDGLAKGGYWLRVECASGPGFYESTRLRPVTSTEWTEVTIEGAVAEDAVNLVFGCGIQGLGTAWFDGIRVEAIP
jgi:erythromycin esterase